MSISPELCHAARALIGLSQHELAARAQVSRKTIVDFEAGQVTPQPRTLRDIVMALESGGVEFLPTGNDLVKDAVRLKWDVTPKD